MTDQEVAFRRVDLPIALRARDLLRRLDRDERIAMLHQSAPAVERLAVAAFHTGCEALHGVAWLGRATVFPQAVGLATTWDVDLIRSVGEVTSVEVRAKRAADGGVSLNVWAPVVNTLRHPGWGRNEEGYSEDPHLTGHFGAAYARGLRGDHERVWRTVPTLKHFLGYNNETDRATTSSTLSLRTLHEEELPAFREPLESGAAGAIMLSYNRVNGVPAHTQPELVAEARGWAPGSIAVVSDAGAPSLLVVAQLAQPDHVAAAAALVHSGLDSFTDNDADAAPTIRYLDEALADGRLTMVDIDAAVLRLLELRLRTGEFDGADDPYAGITADDLDRHASRVLARRVQAGSVVVLRNDAAVLPLVEPTSIAVIGPLADVVLTDWYAGTPPYRVGVASALAERYPAARVEIVTGADTVALCAVSTGRYVGTTATGAPVRVNVAAATHDAWFDVTDWGDGILTLRSHASGGLLDGSGSSAHADAERVGGWVVQQSFRRCVHADGTWSLLHLGSGRWLRVMRGTDLLVADAVTVDQAERFSVRTLLSGQQDAARAAASADIVVVTVGNDPHLAGRETEDRPHLWLPESQAELWRIARGGNPRSVLAVISSYPYVLPDGVAAAETVVWSSHGGQELGHGLVDVLSGDVEPRGRLAQSWPADPEQAGDLFDYDTAAQQATYRHQPLPYAFAFGHGCTYSTVVYDAVRVLEGGSRQEAPGGAVAAGAVTSPARPVFAAPAPTHRHSMFVPREGEAVVYAEVDVRNAGDRAAEELVQLYVRPPSGLPIAAPLRLLVAYERVSLAPGERRTVSLRFAAARLAVWDEAAVAADGAAAAGEVAAGTGGCGHGWCGHGWCGRGWCGRGWCGCGWCGCGWCGCGDGGGRCGYGRCGGRGRCG